MSESGVQSYFISECKKLGGKAVKVDCKSIRGWPDLNVVLPGCHPELVECKTDTGNGRLSEAQIDRHAEMLVMGYRVPVIETKAEVDDWLNSKGFYINMQTSL